MRLTFPLQPLHLGSGPRLLPAPGTRLDHPVGPRKLLTEQLLVLGGADDSSSEEESEDV